MLGHDVPPDRGGPLGGGHGGGHHPDDLFGRVADELREAAIRPHHESAPVHDDPLEGPLEQASLPFVGLQQPLLRRPLRPQVVPRDHTQPERAFAHDPRAHRNGDLLSAPRHDRRLDELRAALREPPRDPRGLRGGDEVEHRGSDHLLHGDPEERGRGLVRIEDRHPVMQPDGVQSGLGEESVSLLRRRPHAGLQLPLRGHPEERCGGREGPLFEVAARPLPALEEQERVSASRPGGDMHGLCDGRLPRERRERLAIEARARLVRGGDPGPEPVSELGPRPVRARLPGRRGCGDRGEAARPSVGDPREERGAGQGLIGDEPAERALHRVGRAVGGSEQSGCHFVQQCPRPSRCVPQRDPCPVWLDHTGRRPATSRPSQNPTSRLTRARQVSSWPPGASSTSAEASAQIFTASSCT